MGELLEELKKATLEEDNKRLREQIEFFNAAGYTVAKTTYNEVVNENVILKERIKELRLELEYYNENSTLDTEMELKALINKMKCCANCKHYEVISQFCKITHQKMYSNFSCTGVSNDWELSK